MWLKKSKDNHALKVADNLTRLKTSGVGLTIDELIQYKQKSSLINLAGVKNIQGRMSGNYLARSKGRGMEFDEVRQYQNGDDIRTIDWRVTARTGKTHTKLFREEIERPVLIATDLSSNMLFGSRLLFKSVQAAHLSALVAWHTSLRGDRIGGVVFNEHQHHELKPRSRQQGVLHYLHALITTHENSEQDLTNSATKTKQTEHALSFQQNCLRIRKIARPGSLVYLITDGYHLDQEAIRHLSSVSQHCELVVCLISDPLEHSLPTSSKRLSVNISDGVNKQQLTLGDKSVAANYQQQAQYYIDKKERLLAKAGARLLHFSAGESLESQLKNGVSAWTR
jgi:uncharacterized protein (DUF58 family)